MDTHDRDETIGASQLAGGITLPQEKADALVAYLDESLKVVAEMLINSTFGVFPADLAVQAGVEATDILKGAHHLSHEKRLEQTRRAIETIARRLGEAAGRMLLREGGEITANSAPSMWFALRTLPSRCRQLFDQAEPLQDAFVRGVEGSLARGLLPVLAPEALKATAEEGQVLKASRDIVMAVDAMDSAAAANTMQFVRSAVPVMGDRNSSTRATAEMLAVINEHIMTATVDDMVLDAVERELTSLAIIYPSQVPSLLLEQAMRRIGAGACDAASGRQIPHVTLSATRRDAAVAFGRQVAALSLHNEIATGPAEVSLDPHLEAPARNKPVAGRT